MLSRSSAITSSAESTRIRPSRGNSRSMITYTVSEMIAANATVCSQLRPWILRRAVADEQRAHETQPAEQQEDDQRRMVPRRHLARRRDVDHLVQRAEQQRRRRGRGALLLNALTTPSPRSPPATPRPRRASLASQRRPRTADKRCNGHRHTCGTAPAAAAARRSAAGRGASRRCRSRSLRRRSGGGGLRTATRRRRT